MMALPKRIFVTGTSTDIGKTVVSAILVAGLRAHYWKPVQTGRSLGTDTVWVAEHTGLPALHFHKETYSLEAPLSPHAAAAMEQVTIALDAFALPAVPSDASLIVEGAGGLMVPLNDSAYMVDLIKRLDLPVILVASSELGTINHTLLSLLELRRQAVPVVGVVMNGPRNAGNRDAIERYGEVPVLAEIEPLTSLDGAALAHCFRRCFQPPS
jgi:dethiobiotin synthetase